VVPAARLLALNSAFLCAAVVTAVGVA